MELRNVACAPSKPNGNEAQKLGIYCSKENVRTVSRVWTGEEQRLEDVPCRMLRFCLHYSCNILKLLKLRSTCIYSDIIGETFGCHLHIVGSTYCILMHLCIRPMALKGHYKIMTSARRWEMFWKNINITTLYQLFRVTICNRRCCHLETRYELPFDKGTQYKKRNPIFNYRLLLTSPTRNYYRLLTYITTKQQY